MTPTREETMPTPTPVPVPTREEIVKLLRRAADIASGWMEEPFATEDARAFTDAADALEAAPVLMFEEKVRQATNAARKASPAFTQRFASATADRIIRAALRAAGVQE